MNVIMFHSIGVDDLLYKNQLSIAFANFHRFCQFLHKKKYKTVFLDEWYQLQKTANKTVKKTVCLTFDDGYLDNWTFAWPVLKKYGLRATIFVNPEFVDPATLKRKNLEDVKFDERALDIKDKLGFLNWAEIETMYKSGVMDIQSHSMSHNFYFYSNRVKDIYNGQLAYNWLAWILKPQRKPFYLNEDQSAFIPAGYPVFEFGRALGLRRYFPDERLIEFAVELFSRADTLADKNSLIDSLNKKVPEFPGRYESDAEMEARYRYELFESKRILEEKLNKKVDYLCWPGGGYNELSINLSIEAGYKASTFSTRDKIPDIDNSGSYKRITRFGMSSFVFVKGGMYPVKNKNFLIQSFKGRSGNIFYRLLLKTRKLFYLLYHSFFKSLPVR
jgi:peptidoglycan/xylan/chitin deacetylase (PgdA/CDA1 family)